ncbi:hypothetical protein NE857_01475 [Nocardiopsis exhalans]|uniref:Uncharacterized protein n=1 Tax=Nocardiopsis exhalans TaxID=163604 RepID=A0ABY5DJV7_9ACTN|nr:hypothetical protein [Nocardiopsis exhalans]USY23525.1 hypothetical protein NE857_01475 [Nocardiopsis exhalans]
MRLSVPYDGAPDGPANLDLVRAIRAEPAPAGAREFLVGGAGAPAATLEDVERAVALVHALTHGAVELALAGHLAPDRGAPTRRAWWTARPPT